MVVGGALGGVTYIGVGLLTQGYVLTVEIYRL